MKKISLVFACIGNHNVNVYFTATHVVMVIQSLPNARNQSQGILCSTISADVQAMMYALLCRCSLWF